MDKLPAGRHVPIGGRPDTPATRSVGDDAGRSTFRTCSSTAAVPNGSVDGAGACSVRRCPPSSGVAGRSRPLVDRVCRSLGRFGRVGTRAGHTGVRFSGMASCIVSRRASASSGCSRSASGRSGAPVETRVSSSGSECRALGRGSVHTTSAPTTPCAVRSGTT